MPGYVSWKQLYQEEYFQLQQEGYDVEGCLPPETKLSVLPFPAGIAPGDGRTASQLERLQWEQAYSRLTDVVKKGIRPDFPYEEPDGLQEILSQAEPCPPLAELSPREYQSRIEGAWRGRCAAVALGKPLEMGFSRQKVREYLQSVNAYPLNDWVPAYSPALDLSLREDCLPSTKGQVAYMQSDDDIHYTILALLLTEKHGTGFSKLDVGMNWLDNLPYHWFWCASRQAYYHLVNLTDEIPEPEAVEAIATTLNPWRECIDGQIRCDFWGYIHPGNPEAAAALAHRDCGLSLTKNGVYGGMFVAGCLAGALTPKPTVSTILQSGFSVIPKNSRLSRALHQVVEWYGETPDWEAVCARIEAQQGHLPFAATLNNLSMVVLAMLHGGLDYTKTITTAVMCGIDTDCNSGTAGSIVGAAVGRSGIEARWIDPLHDTVRSAVSQFGQGSISDLIRRTVNCRQSVSCAKTNHELE